MLILHDTPARNGYVAGRTMEIDLTTGAITVLTPGEALVAAYRTSRVTGEELDEFVSRHLRIGYSLTAPAGA